MSKGWARFALAVVGLLAAAPALAVELELLRHLVAGGEVRFRMNPARVVDELPIDRDGPNVQSTVTARYTVFADLDRIDYAPRGGYFRYRLYVEPKANVPGPTVSYTAKGVPTGSFPPQMAEVSFSLDDGAEGADTISLPLFSLDEPQYLRVPPWDKPQTVELPNGTTIAVPIENLLKLPVRIEPVRQPERGNLWRRAILREKGASDFKAFQLGPSSRPRDALVIDLIPGLGAVSKALFKPGEPQNVEASVKATLPWESVPEQTLEITVPLRFVPWPPVLIIPLGVGTLLGWSLSQLSRKRRLEAGWRTLGVSFLAASLVEIVAMVLVELNSQFKILGFELDPFQVLPTAVIGAVMGLLGMKSVAMVKKLLHIEDGGT